MERVTGTKLWLVTLSSIMLVVASFYLVRMLTSGSSEWPLGVGGWVLK